MLYQDRLGMLFEIPDGQVYGLGFAQDPYAVNESQVLYDGLGNPVGAWPWSNIAKAVGGLVSKALPVATSFLPGGGLINQALPAFAQGFAPGAPSAVAPTTAGPVPVPMPQYPGMMPQYPGMPGGMFPGAPGYPGQMPMSRPWPAGWIRPQLPYTGLGPRRLYMRCAVWPGPRGLVPAIAAQAPMAQAQAAGAAAAQTAMGFMRRHRRRHRRR